jgi:hypothetical protein
VLRRRSERTRELRYGAMARERTEEHRGRRRVVKLLATMALFLVEMKKKTRGEKRTAAEAEEEG